MNLRLRANALRGALLCAVALASPLASAQSKPNAPLNESLTGAARTEYESARILLNNGDFAGAFTKYEQAYAASQDPRLLFNMAVCARNLRAYARMRGLLVRYQREAGATLSPQDKADVNDALAAIRDLVGRVKLAVNEDGAAVAIDGELVGTTPLHDAVVVDLGPHTLSVKKAGFEPVDRPLDVPGGDHEVALTIALAPERLVAQLVVSADEDATVMLDDAMARRQRFEGQVTPGAHRIRVTAPGKITYSTQIDLRIGETRTLQIALEREHGAPAWPWIVGGVAVAAGAVVGGYFLFRPQDSTAAPAPTGQLGSVQLARWSR